MKVIEARNVHAALPAALEVLYLHGVERPSRNGPVLQAPWPVATVYRNPIERVIFWQQRDANPFFHLYESLWMLAGRNDVLGPARYAKRMETFSDDSVTFHGAYGYRWRRHFGRDQLALIASQLRANPEDRRCVLQMWHSEDDLAGTGKDLPCNLTATFQRGLKGELNLTVFCRSNDIIWGCYGANAVHFSFLLEYMALWIGCPVGTYTQVSVNWHGYLDTLTPIAELRNFQYQSESLFQRYPNSARPLSMITLEHGEQPIEVVRRLDQHISQLLSCVDSDFLSRDFNDDEPWREMVYTVLRAHALYSVNPAPDRYDVALRCLAHADQRVDWVVACTEWVKRRQKAWEAKHVS